MSFELNAPFFHRDCVMRGYACDYSEKDMILICGDSCGQEEYPAHGLPAEPTGWLFKRMYITHFRCQVQLRGVNKGKVILAALIDPQTALPRSVVDFCIKQIVGYVVQQLPLTHPPTHPTYPSYLSPCMHTRPSHPFAHPCTTHSPTDPPCLPTHPGCCCT